jgi:hypothetical protein
MSRTALSTRHVVDNAIERFLADLKNWGVHAKGDSEPERDYFSDEEWDMLIQLRHQAHIISGMLNKVPS